MVKKLFIRAILIIVFCFAAYLLDYYFKGKGDYKFLGVGLLILVETSIVMFHKWDKF